MIKPDLEKQEKVLQNDFNIEDKLFKFYQGFHFR